MAEIGLGSAAGHRSAVEVCEAGQACAVVNGCEGVFAEVSGHARSWVAGAVPFHAIQPIEGGNKS